MLEVHAVILLLELRLSLMFQSCGYLNSRTTDMFALLRQLVVYTDFQIVAFYFGSTRGASGPKHFDGSCALEV